MCEYCGCQEVTAIAELTQEHDAVVGMFASARAAVYARDVAAAAAAARSIARVLGPHSRVEEDGLFPSLARDFPDEVAALCDEHRCIEAVLAEAASGVPTDRSWPDRLLKALVMLRTHILKEQDGVFPAALAILRPDDWEQVDRVRAGLAAPVAAR
jgi:Hemerythrin HHE cation binding domain